MDFLKTNTGEIMDYIYTEAGKNYEQRKCRHTNRKKDCEMSFSVVHYGEKERGHFNKAKPRALQARTLKQKSQVHIKD